MAGACGTDMQTQRKERREGNLETWKVTGMMGTPDLRDMCRMPCLSLRKGPCGPSHATCEVQKNERAEIDREEKGRERGGECLCAFGNGCADHTVPAPLTQQLDDLFGGLPPLEARRPHDGANPQAAFSFSVRAQAAAAEAGEG